MRNLGFRELAHPADLALQVRGRDLSSLFLNAAQGLLHLLHASAAEPVGQPINADLSLQAGDLETLMVDWLGEILYLTEREGRCWQVQSVGVERPASLRAHVRCAGDRRPQRAIKAVTYAGLSIVESAAGFETVIVFDA